MKMLVAVVLVVAALSAWGQNPAQTPWPAAVPGFVAPAAGEHPRLFFRRTDIPALRKRAETPEGKAIIKRLRYLLNRGDGLSMPPERRPLDAPYGDASTPIELKEGAFTISHAAGFGFLWQLTGDVRYLDLAKQCFEWSLEGTRDIDGKGRYSFRKPTGALRAGPPLGWHALAYDLCYDGWEPDYRAKIAKALQDYNEGQNMSLSELARGSRLDPSSNHWGPQIGGAALAILALYGDPEAENVWLKEVLANNQKAIMTQLTQGWGEDGWFSQGDGAGAISSDTALVPALQAYRCALGVDYVSPRPNVTWMTMKWVAGATYSGGRVAFPARAMYPHNALARTGLSGSGTFAQGFGAVLPEHVPALLWTYNHYFRAGDEEAGAPFDTVSPYPHRAILAFVNWPLGVAEKNPADVIGRCIRGKGGYMFCRNGWSEDGADTLVSVRASLQEPIIVNAWGTRLDFGKLPGATISYAKESPDGSLIVSNPKGKTFLAIDFSGASGAELMVVLVGAGATGGQSSALKPGACQYTRVTLGGQPVDIRTFSKGPAPEVKTDGDAALVGPQRITFDGEKIILGG